ncbi:molybdenum ABC transporter ATP-binding protein [Phaeovulum sp.]|uniref:molybdenum ABC transporter ATP-binding protein n=1 Tax=Phaeovulum sp. TaxID=2934796 RepID=UPI0039E478FE
MVPSLSVDLTHDFGSFSVDLSFSAPAGLTALFGHSGSGKTTVINAVAGLLRPDRGRITVANRVLLDTATRTSIAPHRRKIGYVFQEARLFPHLTVRQNLFYGHWFAARTPPGVAPERVIEMLGIGALLTRRPGALSGGERQRVAIGRALLSKPQILLMDEPLAALDEARKTEILPYLERLRDETQIPILYVSHSAAEVARLATTIIVLDQGRVRHAGPSARILADPEAALSFGTNEAGALITARIAAHEDDGLTRLETSAGPIWLARVEGAPGTEVRVRLHASDVIVSRSRPDGLSALNILPATVTALDSRGDTRAFVQLRAGNELILARLTARSANALALTPGTGCYAILKSVAVVKGDIGR